MNERAYLDIETSFYGQITVIGIFIAPDNFVHLVGDMIEEYTIMRALDTADVIVTYNGSRFDIPIIKKRLGLDLRSYFKSHDLMYDCWRQGLHGGLKTVEKKLGIGRETEGLCGRDAPVLWERYIRSGDESALDLLLRYNRDDVMNLLVLEERLRGQETDGETVGLLNGRGSR
ncbi:MAG: ribonuclease H-like domain-containing protein [Deltaproteobacteria bacterium]|uniref:Ribonuclease H-like domain-containing protein n=1 Tax=Candidatus Zymogenus saltonus TaxID=2844893 RepID=A0A9D8KGQ3_9DELT|nr:ribonuclease H-like domain-containing protein [Candidatus Zymogenus saltonus]